MSRRRLGWWLRKLANRLDPPRPIGFWTAHHNTTSTTGNVKVIWKESA